MADADVLINPGSTTKIDTRTVGAGTDEHRQVVVLGDPSAAAQVASVDTPADGMADAYGLSILDRNMLWNGSGWDKQRNDVELTLLASASRSVTTQSPDQVGHNAANLLLMINVTSIGTGSITPQLQAKDPISAAYGAFWTAEYAITANGLYLYYFADGASGGSFTECQAFGLAPRVWRLQLTANNANAVTYSASGVMGV